MSAFAWLRMARRVAPVASCIAAVSLYPGSLAAAELANGTPAAEVAYPVVTASEGGYNKPPASERRPRERQRPPIMIFPGRSEPAAASQPAVPDDFVTNGPRFPVAYRAGSFPVEGYVRGGWPFIVDFLPEPDSRTWLEVTLDGRMRFSQLLDLDGRNGRRQVRVELPDGLTDAPRPGIYTVRSARTTNGSVQRDARGNDVPAHVQFYGIGAGPRAVGSVAIDEVTFEPGRLRVAPGRAATAAYGYNARSEFNRAVVEILRFENRNGDIKVERVSSEEQVGVSVGRSPQRAWDGTRAPDAAPSLGVHRLQVRAWFNSEDRSWVGAWSASTVTVSR